MGTFCESGLVIDVVTIATVGGRGDRTEAGRAGVAAAFSTRGRVFVVRTGVTVSVCGDTFQLEQQPCPQVHSLVDWLMENHTNVSSTRAHVPAAVLQVSAGSAAGWLA